MEMKRKLRSYRGAVVDRVGDGTSAAGLEVVAQEERSKKSKTEKKRKSRRLERRVGSVDRVGEEVVTLSEDVENKETRNRKEEAEDLENVAAPSGVTAATESRHTSKQSMRSGSFQRHYDPKKVWVTGLPQDITDDGIRKYFTKCGEISGMYCKGMLLCSNSFKRCLIFTTEAGATKALEYDGSDIGCSVEVWRFIIPQAKVTTPRWGNAPKTPGLLIAIIGNLPEDVDEESIKAFLKESYSAMKIESIQLIHGKTGKFRRRGYVKFGDEESLDAAVKLNETHHLLGKLVKIAYALREPYQPLKQWNRLEQKCVGLRIA